MARKSKKTARKPAVVSAADVGRQLKRLQKSVDALVKHQRLATIFELQGKGAELSVTPEQFEPNREALGKRIENAVRTEDHQDPDTWAYCVINHSGLENFLKREARTSLKQGLARLRANGDNEGALAFGREVIAQL